MPAAPHRTAAPRSGAEHHPGRAARPGGRRPPRETRFTYPGSRSRSTTPRPALTHLCNGDTYHRLAAGFGISVTTAWRYVREAIDLLAAAAPDLATTMTRTGRLSFAILDGTLIPIDRVADDKAYYSGKHRRHGMNVPVVADPAGRLICASPACPAERTISPRRTPTA